MSTGPPEPREGTNWNRVVILLAVLGLVVGWNAFHFLCDDAFIDFRYVANARAGFGLVWNLPPFQPVEGYTSVLWVLVLWGTWATTGLDPTKTAGWLGLLFAFGTLLQTSRWALSIPAGRRQPVVLLLVLLGTLSNRTFLAWTSSGLETPLWVFLLVSWCRALWTDGARSTAPAMWAALLSVTRPDGMLFAGCTLLLAVQTRRTLAAWPLLLLPAHLLWRHHTYGVWLPNTAYAKVTGAWPEAGVRYAAAFVIEYAWWLGAACLAVLAAKSRPAVRAIWSINLPRATMLLALAAHVGWYTFWVGGDHFEFRVYAHLVPLLWLGLTAALVRLHGALDGTAIGVLVAQLLLSLPIPWTHYALSQGIGLDGDVHAIVVPVAPALPPPLSWMATPWDQLEAWLIPHYIGMRHQEHKAFATVTRRVFGKRRGDTPSLNAGDIDVFSAVSIGVPGWTMPSVAVVDPCGLVDAVVARNPLLRGSQLMAHQRQPPVGYLECFDQNIGFSATGLARRTRPDPLTADEVRACETTWWANAGMERPAPSR
ncbi:MAG: hypothetical protein EXR69_03555 [Myxococcales bacterium]|nr:hypothetical protein [Myxococcales bacterium]